MVTFCTLHVAQRLHFFEPKAIDGQTVILFGLLNGTSIGLLNLSLGFNSIGFYQVSSIWVPFSIKTRANKLNSLCSADDKIGNYTLHCAIGDNLPEKKIQV
jgi:solute carrier family 35 protein E3